MKPHPLILQMRAAIRKVGWSEAARRSGINRVTLHRAFGTTNKVKGPRGSIGPSLETVLAVAPHVGLTLKLESSE